ncbi:helicase associated domain-containing protein [uncultured Pseudonocardia sp.]|uniref:helicase associated domain-containing protein n=1 Tax=uncultured Pseudonocardia sp. TaxID=211455 RepID=UPI00261F80A6|nr:Helicase associated domain protein [uncultured Pseudonocardia sp.]
MPTPPAHATDTADEAGVGTDADTELGGTGWRHVWTVLRALASMDDRFAARLRERVHPAGGGARGGDARGSPQPTLTLPDGLDLDRFLLRWLDRTGGPWWARYELLAQHARETGAARPSATVIRGGVALHGWVARQRTLHRHGELEPDRVEALQQLPGWAWDAREIAWWTAAKVWRRRHGATTVGEFERWAWLAEVPTWPTGHDKPARAYASLAEFAVATCGRRRRGELPAHLERAAAELPGWSCVPADDAAMVDALAGYSEWEKTLNPPHDFHDDAGRPLGAWLTAVRRRHYTGRLHPALELELALLGREHHRWQPLRWEKGDTGWRLSYLALRQFVAREHTTRVPTDHEEHLPTARSTSPAGASCSACSSGTDASPPTASPRSSRSPAGSGRSPSAPASGPCSTTSSTATAGRMPEAAAATRAATPTPPRPGAWPRRAPTSSTPAPPASTCGGYWPAAPHRHRSPARPG